MKNKRNLSELLKSFLNGGIKRGAGLKECIGILKKDKEWKEVREIAKRGWGRWTKCSI